MDDRRLRRRGGQVGHEAHDAAVENAKTRNRASAVTPARRHCAEMSARSFVSSSPLHESVTSRFDSLSVVPSHTCTTLTTPDERRNGPCCSPCQECERWSEGLWIGRCLP